MPYRLPPDLGDFTGRTGAVAELTGALAVGQSMPVAAVNGMGGVGKTTLAVHVAHAMEQRFAGGSLHVNLRGMAERPAEPYAVLGSLLRVLGLADVPNSLEERAALYRSELAERNMLVVLDDARGPDQVRPLLPGTPGSAVLVTSRSTMADLDGVTCVELDVLDPPEAIELLASAVGEDRVAAERAAALDLVAACGFLPLAIRCAAAWLADRPAPAIGVLAHHLSHGRMEELPAAVACFRLGYDLLGTDEARAFRLLALADGPGFSTAAAGAVLGMRRQHVDDILESLADRSLLESPAPNRYRFHGLVRTFALKRADRKDERVRALSGLLEYYVTVTGQAARVLQTTGGTGTGVFTTPDVARTWLFVEQDAILTAIERAAAEPDGPLALAAELLVTVTPLLDREWNPCRVHAAAQGVRDAARHRGDALAELRADHALGDLGGQPSLRPPYQN